MVRAATELGVARVQLLVTRRADAREIGAQKLTRLNRIAEEASKQSRRAVTPAVLPGGFDGFPVGRPALRGPARLQPASDRSPGLGGASTVLTGPEGGLTDEEVTQLTTRGASAVTLGPRILRAETAPVALLGAIAALGQ
ncbi:RsmE family RNA methyltransferase [Deinococcus malanensis]|uniref:RsmE family RNA methyltransferase n=1 Tax=Deinococcus malanensis TaxID=1706855 RepID=UPI003625AF3C